MNIYWEISQSDIHKLKDLIAKNDNPFLKARNLRNVEKQNIVIDKNSIVKTMTMCLLTSQQRSGPNSIVGQFLSQEPFPITIEKLENKENIEEFINFTLNKFGLTRYINKISTFFASNYQKIQNSDWSIIYELQELLDNNSRIKEREIADKLNEEFKGFGPKQSRNFLQALGLTKYEIPIDSRIAKWLSEFGFPLTLTSSPLSDVGYYHFVLDGIQELCKKADIYPCILDAAIFSSYDNDEWTEENSIF